MRPPSVIKAEMDAEKERHRTTWKRLLREYTEARGKRYAPAKMKEIETAFRIGMSQPEIRAKFGLTRGQLNGLVYYRKWKRDGVHTVAQPDTLYRKLRRVLGMSREEALAEVSRLSAGDTGTALPLEFGGGE